MRSFFALFLLACVPEAEVPAAAFAERVEAASTARFAIPDHALVRERYARMVASERGRQFLAEALDRRDDWPWIADRIAARGLPAQLEAVVLVESGFANLEPQPSFPSAGLWQFIPETARRYGLVVDGEVDQRLDPDRATDAALSLLDDLHGELGDWGLAIAAYNVGAGRVRAAIAKEGTDDVFELIDRGALPTYAADVMAAALVLAQ